MSVQWLVGNRDEVSEFLGDSLVRFDGDHQQVSVVISNGEVTANPGDFISRDRAGLLHVSHFVRTDNMFEMHPPGTVIELVDEDGDGELFTVGPDGFWRNEYGMIPAGQTAAPPEPSGLAEHCPNCRCGDRYLPPKHCRGCQRELSHSDEQGPGRIPHGGSL